MVIYVLGEWSLEQRKLIHEKRLDKYYDSERYIIKKVCELYKALMGDLVPQDIPLCQSDFAKVIQIAFRNRCKPMDMIEKIVGRHDHQEIQNIFIAFCNFIAYERWDSITAGQIEYTTLKKLAT
jgi:hypothetical protein